MEKILIGLFMGYVVYRLWCIQKDINNLYSSRDGLWRELNTEIQTRKRQTTLLRQRVHGLRELLKSGRYG